MLDLGRSSPAVIPVSGAALVVAPFWRLGPPSSAFAAMVDGERNCSLTATRLTLENSLQDQVGSDSVVVLETGPKRSGDLEIWRSGSALVEDDSSVSARIEQRINP